MSTSTCHKPSCAVGGPTPRRSITCAVRASSAVRGWPSTLSPPIPPSESFGGDPGACPLDATRHTPQQDILPRTSQTYADFPSSAGADNADLTHSFRSSLWMPCHTCPRGCSTDCCKPALVVRAHLVFDSLARVEWDLPCRVRPGPSRKSLQSPNAHPTRQVCRVVPCVWCAESCL